MVGGGPLAPRSGVLVFLTEILVPRTEMLVSVSGTGLTTKNMFGFLKVDIYFLLELYCKDGHHGSCQ